MSNKIIGKIAATEKYPTTVDDFCFWTSQDEILNPFDVIKVEHIHDSITYGIVEEISHITDAPSYLTAFISHDFGDVGAESYTERIGMNYIKAKVIRNTKNIYIPVINGKTVSFASKEEAEEALGLKNVENPVVCGYLQLYDNAEEKERVALKVSFNSEFLIGPEAAHLNISGISGLAAKTSYAMFLLKAIQEKYLRKKEESNEKEPQSTDSTDSCAFIFLNVKGRDLLGIDVPNAELSSADKDIYKMLELESEPFKNVKYFYPFSKDNYNNTYADKDIIDSQKERNKCWFYKYEYEHDKDKLDLLFSNIDDQSQTMDSIINYIRAEQGNFGKIKSWNDFNVELNSYGKAGNPNADKEIPVVSWRKFKRIIDKTLRNSMFAKDARGDDETRLQDTIQNIKQNDVFVVDIAKLDETLQGFVFGDVIRSVYDLKLGQINREDEDIPKRIIVFIDELNKYASSDVPKNSPILSQLIDIAERGRSLGIVLFGAEQFRSVINDRIKGNCATQAYGRTNAIEVSKKDYQYVPAVYKSMMTRLEPGEYILQNPLFRSVLKIKFPRPVYYQYKN